MGRSTISGVNWTREDAERALCELRKLGLDGEVRHYPGLITEWVVEWPLCTTFRKRQAKDAAKAYSRRKNAVIVHCNDEDGNEFLWIEDREKVERDLGRDVDEYETIEALQWLVEWLSE